MKKPIAAAAISPGVFKKVVREVFEDEDRSKNIMVFGLVEEAGEKLDDKISGIFLELEEKPRSEAVRLSESVKFLRRVTVVDLSRSHSPAPRQ